MPLAKSVPTRSACPDAETLAEYAEGRLEGVAREKVELHLAQCANCRAVVVETVQFVNDEDRSAVPQRPADQQRKTLPFSPHRTAIWVAVGLAAAAALFLVVRLQQRSSADERTRALVAELRTAADSQSTRPFDARLTLGLRYLPAATTRSGAEWIVPPEIRLAASRLEQATESASSAAAVWTRGVSKLMTGELDGAIGDLERAASVQPDNAVYLSDLSAAYLTRGRTRRNPDDLSKAHAAAMRATTADANLAEAWFNRGLAAAAAGQSSDAADAWRRYLALDSSSPWAAEAKRHLTDAGK